MDPFLCFLCLPLRRYLSFLHHLIINAVYLDPGLDKLNTDCTVHFHVHFAFDPTRPEHRNALKWTPVHGELCCVIVCYHGDDRGHVTCVGGGHPVG